jgi:cytochrome c biogenesis protein CcdA/thiol-disulfide isomerase/thioredoxin
MALLVLFAFLAGVVTILSPCILPLLPVIMSGGVAGGKARPWGIIAGFILVFTTASLFLAALLKLIGLNGNILRWAAAVVVMAFGIVMVVPPLQKAFSRLVSRLTSRTAGSSVSAPRHGFWGGLTLGASLGLVWAPCVGPILGSVFSLAAAGALDAGAVLITAAYAAGTALPLLGIMIGGRGLLDRLPFLKRRGEAIQRFFGALMIAAGLLIVTGLDIQFNNLIQTVLPQYGAGLTGIENQKAITEALAQRDTAAKTQAAPPKPEDVLALGGAWLNGKPLTTVDLKGKVVLVDFWTYSCINCIRTFPYLRAWDARYREHGLVIIGVHTPEFAFEKDPGNVSQATRAFGLAYPIVQDNDYRVWRAFNNHYWPADFLFDADGKLVDTHYGEGDYDKTEALIQKLTGMSGATAAGAIAPTLPVNAQRTPEAYLGYGRADLTIAPTAPRDRPWTFALSPSLEPNHWSLGGPWTQETEDIRAEGPGSLAIQFRAQHVYAVLGPAGPGPSPTVLVTIDGKPVDTRAIPGGVLVLDGYRLYELYSGAGLAEGRLVIETAGPLKAYTFTFG